MARRDQHFETFRLAGREGPPEQIRQAGFAQRHIAEKSPAFMAAITLWSVARLKQP